MLRREQFFECVVSQGLGESSLVVRAWSADEAERSVLEELASQGITAPFRITVSALATTSARGCLDVVGAKVGPLPS